MPFLSSWCSRTYGQGAAGSRKAPTMLDILLIALTAMLFAAAIGYAYFCEQL